KGNCCEEETSPEESFQATRWSARNGQEQTVREPRGPTAEFAQRRARLHCECRELQRAAFQFVAERELGRVLFSTGRRVGAWTISGQSGVRAYSDGQRRLRCCSAAVGDD